MAVFTMASACAQPHCRHCGPTAHSCSAPSTPPPPPLCAQIWQCGTLEGSPVFARWPRFPQASSLLHNKALANSVRAAEVARWMNLKSSTTIAIPGPPEVSPPVHPTLLLAVSKQKQLISGLCSGRSGSRNRDEIGCSQPKRKTLFLHL